MGQYYHDSEHNESQIDANEGRFMLFVSDIFFSVTNITFEVY
jgi:hypothetical protein